MLEETVEQRSSVAAWVRVAILLLATGSALALSYLHTGDILPKRPEHSLIFQNALLLVVLGSAVIEFKFTKPQHALVNGLMGVVTLLTVYGYAPSRPWWIAFAYCSLVFVSALVCVGLSSPAPVRGW